MLHLNSMEVISLVKTLVAFEEAYDVETNTLVADHKDIDDGEQTVVVPKIGTTLTDKDGNKTVKRRKRNCF